MSCDSSAGMRWCGGVPSTISRANCAHSSRRLVDFGDAGRTIPDVYVLVGSRLVNLSGLADEGQMLGLAGVEVRAHAPDQPVVIIATSRNL